MKTCVSCGMPMKDATEFVMNELNKDYCIHCAQPDGSMQAFEEKREGLIHFIIRTKRVDKETALETAENMMRKLPAWAHHFSG